MHGPVVSTDCFLGFGTFNSVMGMRHWANHVVVTQISL